ncbi:hypothetical protein B7494_g563 [Chlorociboria aeruginascens]|nr:hypothetical protein B7494_g563 [Chlorociboria aeruginascens]
MAFTDPSLDFDVIIVGAGISGINSAYRLQTELPNYKYTILESRGAIGGTWDLFRFPGIRSDSDLHTFAFPWRPWTERQTIAQGALIRNYLRESAEAFGIDERIQFHHKLIEADWSSEQQAWTLNVEGGEKQKTIRSKFVILGTGYYDYNQPLQANIPGLENFQGKIIHPQFWPEDLDYTGKKMVVIGSGATAVTLIPILAEKAAKVTMLQRSPSYIISVPSVDPSSTFLRKFLPLSWAQFLTRWKLLVVPFLFFQFCRTCPGTARTLLRNRTEKSLAKTSIPLDPNFNPSYGPWEQRLCVCPDHDFYKSLRRNADVVTDTIQTVTQTGIRTQKGLDLEADIIVTATGLKLQFGGGARFSVDGKPIVFNEKFLWRGIMMQDLPNVAFVIGYDNASWTLGSDTTALIVCRLLKHMESKKLDSATPKVKDASKINPRPLMSLSSTYIEKAKGDMPMAGDVAPWKPRSNYLSDSWTAMWGNVTTDMSFVKAVKRV